jgi:hypothetical protein
MPAFMYGTAWKKEATTQLVIEAITAGFSAIDTANQLIHYDEARVGEARPAVPPNEIHARQRAGPSNSLRRPSADYDASPPIVRKFAHPFTHGLPRFLCPPRAVLSKRIRAGRLGGVVGH